ncbi:hypothetical protein ACP4OV_028662 [Aristida adscensionis]
MAPTAEPSSPPLPPPRRPRSGPPPGLKNLGNTCYLNSVLQCLAATPPLASFCLASRHSNLCKKVFPNRDKECAFCVLERQIARLLRADAGSLDSPGKIIRCLPLFAEHFRWGRQEDAHEFLCYVVDACHTAGLRIRKRLPVAGANLNSGEEGRGQGPCMVMKETFGGALLSQVKCLVCKGESNKTDEIMDISLDLLGCSSVGDALARFFQPEILEGANKYSCERCKKLTSARKQMFMLRAPKVLAIQLKRFEGINGGKINRNIEFKETLVLSDYIYNKKQVIVERKYVGHPRCPNCSACYEIRMAELETLTVLTWVVIKNIIPVAAKRRDSQPVYNLFSCIVHSGLSQDSGHYYAYVKDAIGRWYCCNDSHVSLSSSQDVLSQKVYILFYVLSSKAQKPSTNGYSSTAAKSSGTNGNATSNTTSSETLKVPLVKQNGSCSTKGNTLLPLKNGKNTSGPCIKPIHLKNSSTEKVTTNGKVNLTSKNNTEVCESTTLSEVHGCQTGKPAEPNIKSANGAISCEKMDDNPERISQDANGNGDYLAESSNVKTSRAQQYSDQSSGAVSVASSGSVLHQEDSANLVKDAMSSPKNSVCLKRKLDEERLKDMLAKSADSDLRSSDWVDNVTNFMRSVKRQHIENNGMPQDFDAKRLLLKADSAKIFRSKIPESLTGYLIQHLRSYFESKF